MWRIRFDQYVLSDGHWWENENPHRNLPTFPLHQTLHISEIDAPQNSSIDDMYERGISPRDFRRIRQAHEEALKRRDGRMWSTLAVPRLIEHAMILTNGSEQYRLSFHSRAPWETTDYEYHQDMLQFRTREWAENHSNNRTISGLSYSYLN